MKTLIVGLCTMGLAGAAFAADDEAMGRRVQDLLHVHQADVFGCVAASPAAARGEMLVRVVVGPDQRPAKAEVLKDQSGAPAMGTCITTKVQKWDLTPLQAAAGDQIVFPLVFKPELLPAGKKRILVPMSAQESAGPNRFLIDDQSIGEAPLASMQIVSVPALGTLNPSEKGANEEEVLYVLEGAAKVGTEVVRAGDAVWFGNDVQRPSITPAEKKPFRLLDVRAVGEGKGQKVVRGAEAKSYPLGDKGAAKLLLDGIGAHLAVDVLTADAGAAIPSHKHATQDEELYFLSGRATTTVGKESFDIAPGDALRIPAGAVHTVQVADKLEAIQIYAPAGPEQRFKSGSAGGDEPAPARTKTKKKK
jgi:mannose-6-phosphate isomerase-like protein (cupin superfamily)